MRGVLWPAVMTRPRDASTERLLRFPLGRDTLEICQQCSAASSRPRSAWRPPPPIETEPRRSTPLSLEGL